MKKLKVIVDCHVPYMESLSRIADVVTLDPAAITREAVTGADAIIVRTRTRCDARLLEGTGVRFVATATIGTDHIDLDWCRSAGIKTANAPGCNAPAVAQYVFASLMELINRPLRSYTIGIVGVGHVGSIVERWARSMNMNVMLCDPPRAEAEGGDQWSTISDIAREADIITFHTPLTSAGKWPSRHLAGREFFSSLRRAPIVINAARGPVADTDAWIEAIESGMVGASVVDCWEGEPSINPRMLELADIATPHIAGYSADGKKRASQMVLDSLCDFFGLPRLDTGLCISPIPEAVTPSTIAASYTPLADTAMLRQAPDKFEKLRDHYDLRPETPGRLEE